MTPGPSIHPSALVMNGAQLGEGVSVGPFAVIEAGARIGDRCRVEAHAQVTRWVRLGPGCIVSRGAILGGDPQDLKFDPSADSWVEAGPNNVFREFTTVHRSATPGGITRIGADNFLMCGTHIGHDCVVGSENILANDVLLGGHVLVGNRNFFGGGSAVHQFIRIGSLAMIKGHASISQDVPPFVIVRRENAVVGLNVVGLRRAGVDAESRLDIKRAFNAIYRATVPLGPLVEQLLTRVWSAEANDFLSFFRTPGRHGFCQLESRRQNG